MNEDLKGRRIGPFDLDGFLGQGAMGRVFRARYPAQGVEVAVKVIHEQNALRPGSIEAFQREIQAMAGLDHPGIVHIYDYGITTEFETEGWDELSPGIPWLAMELGTGHSLDSAPPIGDWTIIKRVLLEILDALAHAHARGIVHRDLKPANILVARGDCGLKVLLADFGIAHVWDSKANTDTKAVGAVSAGTPFYMAPEQLHGRWRDYGAWTDLYAFGCVAFELICGEPPFDAPSVFQLAMRHMSDPVPPLRPRFEVPAGLDEWFEQLLAKDPYARVSSAAEAAWLLNEIEGKSAWPRRLDRSDFTTPIEQDSEAGSVDPVGATLDFAATNLLSAHQLAEAVGQDRRDQTASVAAGRRTSSRGRHIPFPLVWKPPRTSRRSQLRGAGEALVGLREVPFVDRDDARTTIWRSLRNAHEAREPQLVFVSSKAGLGKSRLVEWTTRRAHELGVGPTLRLSSSQVAGADEPLVQVIEEMFRLQGMSRARAWERILDILERIEAQLPDDAEIPWNREHHAAALANLIRPVEQPDESDPVPFVTFERAAEKYELITRFLYAYSRQDTVTIWCDDAHYCRSLLGLIEHVCGNPIEGFPVVFVVSYRPETLEGRPLEADTIARLKRYPHVALELGPLSDADQFELVQRALTLAPELVEDVANRTAGDPFFATQLLESWVEDGVLIPSADETGYIVDDSAVFPSNVQELAAYRLRRFIEQWDDRGSIQTLLALAAAVARPVNEDLLRALSARLEVELPDRFMERVLNSGIGRRVRDGWTFDEGLFRDAVQRLAEQHGIWRAVHLACADELADTGDGGDERMARHLLAAGKPRAALAPLARAVDQKMLESAYAQVRYLADEMLGICDLVGLDGTDARRAHATIRRAEALRFAGSFAESEEAIESLLPRVQALEPYWAAELWRVKAGLELMKADLPASLLAYERAARQFLAGGHDVGLSRVRHGEGFLLITTGQWDEAQNRLDEALNAAKRGRSPRDIGWAHHGLAELELRRNPLIGRQHSEAALEIFRTIGSMSGIALSHRTAGDCCRMAGLADLAADHYSAMLQISEQIRSVHQAFGFLGLSLIALEAQDYESAVTYLEPLLDHLDEIPKLFQPIPLLALMHAYAGLERDEPFDQVADLVEPMMGVGALAHPDLITLPERSGDLHWNRGDTVRARRSYMMAAGFAAATPGDDAERIRRKNDTMNR